MVVVRKRSYTLFYPTKEELDSLLKVLNAPSNLLFDFEQLYSDITVLGLEFNGARANGGKDDGSLTLGVQKLPSYLGALDFRIAAYSGFEYRRPERLVGKDTGYEIMKHYLNQLISVLQSRNVRGI